MPTEAPREPLLEEYYFVASALNLETFLIFQNSCLALTENLVECFVHRRYLHFLCQIVADRLSNMSKEVKSGSVSLCPLGTAAAPEQEPLCIFGTGDFGRSLGQRLLQSGYKVVYGSRRPHSCDPLPQGAQVQQQAASCMTSSQTKLFFAALFDHYCCCNWQLILQNVCCMMVLHILK